jgi:hypothetical protein
MFYAEPAILFFLRDAHPLSIGPWWIEEHDFRNHRRSTNANSRNDNKWRSEGADAVNWSMLFYSRLRPKRGRLGLLVQNAGALVAEVAA